jgi:hypothetical protein
LSLSCFHLQTVTGRRFCSDPLWVYGTASVSHHAIVDAVLYICAVIGHSKQPLDVGVVIREQKFGMAVAKAAGAPSCQNDSREWRARPRPDRSPIGPCAGRVPMPRCYGTRSSAIDPGWPSGARDRSP